jgi:hypothetical protein
LTAFTRTPFGASSKAAHTGELIDGSFADAIGENAWKRAQTSHAGNIYDVSFVLDDRRQSELRELKDGPNVDVHHDVVSGHCGVFNRAAGDDARRVYQHIDTSKIFQKLLDEACCIALVQEVDNVGLDIRRLDFRKNFLLPSGRRDLSALFDKLPRGRHPDSARRARYDCDPFLQIPSSFLLVS